MYLNKLLGDVLDRVIVADGDDVPESIGVSQLNLDVWGDVQLHPDPVFELRHEVSRMTMGQMRVLVGRQHHHIDRAIHGSGGRDQRGQNEDEGGVQTLAFSLY